MGRTAATNAVLPFQALDEMITSLSAMDQTKLEIRALVASQSNAVATADKHGQVKLRLEKALLKENPEVKVSEQPSGIAPDMADMD